MKDVPAFFRTHGGSIGHTRMSFGFPTSPRLPPPPRLRRTRRRTVRVSSSLFRGSMLQFFLNPLGKRCMLWDTIVDQKLETRNFEPGTESIGIRLHYRVESID